VAGPGGGAAGVAGSGGEAGGDDAGDFAGCAVAVGVDEGFGGGGEFGPGGGFVEESGAGVFPILLTPI
jgi:hypothetical protein